MRILIPLFVGLLLVAGCGSSQKSSEEERTARASAPRGRNAPSGQTADSADAASQTPVRDFGHPFRAPPPSAPVADPVTVISTYQRDCAKEDTSAACSALRVQVELAFLDALVTLRAAHQQIDRSWYRLAAGAEVPQLACMGLRELLWSKERSAAEDALIVAALDSPYRGPRNTVLTYARNVATLLPLLRRAAPTSEAKADAFIDGRRDPEPDPSTAGGYPGVRYRYFASNAARDWYSTTDPPEKVIAFLTKGGKPALTAAEFEKAQQAELMAELTKAAESEDPTKMTSILAGSSAATNANYWTRPFDHLDAAGEVRYVALAPNRVVAIFRDDVLHATSIVALEPPLAFDTAALDPQKGPAIAEFDEAARQMFRH